MPRVDAHQHFWNYSAEEYPWIQPGSPLQRSFLPSDLQPLLRAAEIDACVAVQARQSFQETEWLLGLAREAEFIAGVVGWVDLRGADLRERLTLLTHNPKFVGVRHVVQEERDERFMLGAEFVRGIGMLEEFHLAYDILIYPKQLPAAIELAKRFPKQRFVLDHMAKPNIAAAQMEPWRAQFKELAKSPNVFCKISGLVTEARWQKWRADDFRPYLDVAWEAFGENRLMLGSDWPVALNSASYAATIGLATDFLAQFAPATREKVRGQNAIDFYKLKF